MREIAVTNIRQQFSNARRSVSAHPLMTVGIVAILYFLGRFALLVWSIFDAIPELPNGPLQIVGITSDGARFVVLDDEGHVSGGNRVTVLVVLKELLQHEQGAVRFQVNRELIDCSKHQIQLQGAGFYDDQGRQTIARVYDQPAVPFEPIDAETRLVCDNQDSGQPMVVGYIAALAQAQDLISQALSAR